MSKTSRHSLKRPKRSKRPKRHTSQAKKRKKTVKTTVSGNGWIKIFSKLITLVMPMMVSLRNLFGS